MSMTTLDRPAVPVVDAPPLSETPPLKDAPRPRLSEAMRKGARYHPQSQGSLYNPATGTTCALGALAVGVLGPAWTVFTPRLFWGRSLRNTVLEQTGVDLDLVVAGPRCYGPGLVQGPLASLIMWLNDHEGWSREAIADWLESIGY